LEEDTRAASNQARSRLAIHVSEVPGCGQGNRAVSKHTAALIFNLELILYFCLSVFLDKFHNVSLTYSFIFLGVWTIGWLLELYNPYVGKATMRELIFLIVATILLLTKIYDIVQLF
jgi:hypothetical protein